jgi:hypothetical protein
MKTTKVETRRKYTSNISVSDQTQLERFRIKPEITNAAGIYRVTDLRAREAGFTCGGAKDLSGLVFPYVDADGELFNARLRRDNPETDDKGKIKNKYLSLSAKFAKRRGLYAAPGAYDLLKKKSDCRVGLVEAEKSALAWASHAKRIGSEIAVFAMGGSNGWREEGKALADLDLLRGHPVTLILDSNVNSNPQVKLAELNLALHISGTLECDFRSLLLPPDVNGPDDYLAKYKDREFLALLNSKSRAPWLDEIRHTFAEYQAATPPEFIIDQILQSDGATVFAGLAGHGKSWILLNIVRSLLTGEKLFGYFPVIERSKRVILLTPEISLGQFKRRAELFGLGQFIENEQLFVQTLSKYPMVKLRDAALLLCAGGADIILDTFVRFMDGDENSSGDNNRGLAEGIFRLLNAGARSVIGAAHAPKGFEKSDHMTLENMIRGSGDIGAMLSTAYGVRQIDPVANILHVECIKPRDINPVQPFQITGRPYIDSHEGFKLTLKPGDAGPLKAYMKDLQSRGGRPKSEEKLERQKLMVEMIVDKKRLEDITAAVTETFGVKAGTVRKEMVEARRIARLKCVAGGRQSSQLSVEG